MAKGDLGLSVKAKWISDEDELFSFFKTLGKKYAKKIYRTAMRRVAERVRDEMRLRSPVDTGALDAAMIIRKPEGFKAKRGAMLIGAVISGRKLMSATEKDYPYYLAVEYGTAKMSPDPFLRPAVAIVQNEARAIFIEESKKILNSEMPKGVK